MVEAFLNLLKLGVSVKHDLMQVGDLDNDKSSRIFVHCLHEHSPILVNFSELVAFHRHLFHDVFRGENRLKVHPNSLHFQPHLDIVLSSLQLIFPSYDFLQIVFGKWRAFHGLGFNQVII